MSWNIALEFAGNGCRPHLGFLLWRNCFVSPAFPKIGSSAASPRLSNKLHYFLQSWEPLPSLNWKDSSVSLNCTTTGSSFLDIIAKFQVFISWERPWAVSNLQRFVSIVVWKAWSINSYLCHYMQLSNMLRATILKGLPLGNSMQIEFRLFSHTIMDADFWAFFFIYLQ